MSDRNVRKMITVMKQNELKWLYDYDCDIVKQAVKEKKGKPKFKSKKHAKPAFYVDGYRLKIQDGYIKIPNCTKIKLYEKDYVPENLKYQNPRITFDGVSWFISVGVKEKIVKPQLTDETIGVDLGLKELATCSNGIVFHNVAKFANYQKLEKSIKQKQRQLARKYLLNKEGNKFVKTKNIQKLELVTQKKRIRQNNIKKDYFHKSSTKLVRTKPTCIVLEDLDVASMRKNKHLSHAVQSASISMFKEMLVNKAISLGIEILYADRYFPSSQICSNCGNRKPIKLSERIYKCSKCGLEIDRDLNASINLKHYREFLEKLSLWRAKTTKVA